MRFRPSEEIATTHASWKICTQYGFRMSRPERSWIRTERMANGRTALAMFFRVVIAPPSHILRPGLPEDPGRLPQQHGDEEDEGDPVPVDGREIRRGHRLRKPHDQSPEDRPRDGPDA